MIEPNNSNKPNGTGIARVFKATYCSMKGFKAAWVHEAAFRQETIMVAVLLPFSFFIANNLLHLLILLFSLLFLLFAELTNSAIEALADKVCLEQDPLIGRAKDIGSAIVFIGLVFMKLVWGLTILDYFGWYSFN